MPLTRKKGPPVKPPAPPEPPFPFSRRALLKTAGVLAGLSFMPWAGAASPPAAGNGAAPNILVMVADDLGWGDVGFHGGAPHTPNLDRLAKDGLELQRFYVYPVCSPTRAALLTGQMPRRFGIATIIGPREAGLPAGVTTLPRTLQAAGYQTALIGKWHLGAQSPPQQNGFDHFYGFLGPEIDYSKHTGRNGATDWQRDGKTLEETGYSTFLFADEAVRQLEKRDATRPFFLEVAFNAPHFPLSAPDEYLTKYKNLPRQQATYAAVVDALDAAVGRILAALDRQGLRNNTLVVFFSDNGASSREGGSNGSFRGGKDTVFEGGIHTPCLMRWPGRLAAGAASRQPLSVQDLFPTLAAAADVPLKNAAKLDGKNLWDPLRTGRVQDRGTLVIAGTEFAVIDGDWKLIETGTGTRALYQLARDPGETADLYATSTDTAHRLEAVLTEVKNEFPAVTAKPRPPPPGNRSAKGGGTSGAK